MSKQEIEQLWELQGRQAELRRHVLQLTSQMNVVQRDSNILDITVREIDAMPDQTKVYMSIGKMFALNPKDELRKQLINERDDSLKKNEDRKRLRAQFVDKLKESEERIGEIANQIAASRLHFSSDGSDSVYSDKEVRGVTGFSAGPERSANVSQSHPIPNEVPSRPFSTKRTMPPFINFQILFTFVSPQTIPTRHRLKSRPARKCNSTATSKFVILGGSSGVGLEAANYLRSRSAPVRSFSRSTGHDLSSLQTAEAVLQHVSEGVAVCVGAGRRKASMDEEIQLYSTVITALSGTNATGFVVLVVRSLVLSAVKEMAENKLEGQWVLLRPGAMVDRAESCETQSSSSNSLHRHAEWKSLFRERLMVTPDIRCNGLVSRRSVGRVIGDILLGDLGTGEISGQVLGVYDAERMISSPRGCRLVGMELWG